MKLNQYDLHDYEKQTLFEVYRFIQSTAIDNRYLHYRHPLLVQEHLKVFLFGAVIIMHNDRL